MELTFSDGGGRGGRGRNTNLAGGESTEEGGGGVFPGGGGWENFRLVVGTTPISPHYDRENPYVATANCIINVLFDDHKILIMYQSNYYQNELKTLDVKLTFDVKWHQILAIIIN